MPTATATDGAPLHHDLEGTGGHSPRVDASAQMARRWRALWESAP